MKNKVLFLGTLIAIAGIMLTGCFSSIPVVTTTAEVNYRNWGAFGENAIIPVKDFESKGLVFTEVQFQITEQGTIEGNVFTYQALLKEAAKLGADAVINVTIDKRTEKVSSGFGKKTNKQETWYGSALAIKYTNVLPLENQDTPITNRPRIFSTSGSAYVVSEN